MKKLLFCLMVVLSLGAQELSIRSGGNRIVDWDNIRDDNNCQQTTYAPFILRDSSPVIQGRSEVMYLMGGSLVSSEPYSDGLTSTYRFADKIVYTYKLPSGQWDSPRTIIHKSFFPWMRDENYLRDHLDSFIGAVASPSVVKVNGKYFMSFVATVNDMNVCAGEHPVDYSTPFGSCQEPWSFFALYWATSDDGEHWTLQEPPRWWGAIGPEPIQTAAIAHSVLYREPRPDDRNPLRGSGGYKGITSTSLVYDNGFFYVLFNFWAVDGPKNGIARMAYDGSTASGLNGFTEVWDNYNQRWEQCYGGSLPDWVGDNNWRGVLFPITPGKISVTTQMPGYKYIVLLSESSWQPRSASMRGTGNMIGYSLSNDLVHWTPNKIVKSYIPYFADGQGYDASIMDPQYFEDKAGYHFLFQSMDGGYVGGYRDGRHDCNLDIWMGVFYGMGIYQGDSAPPPPRRRTVGSSKKTGTDSALIKRIHG